jgi:hypothetical protein
MRKAAVLTGPDRGIDRRFQPQGGLTLRRHEATPDELAAADRVLTAVPCARSELLYARVDLVTDENGRAVLMELELTEPQLYFGHVPATADRMAAAIEDRVKEETHSCRSHETGATTERCGFAFSRSRQARA